MRSIFLIAVMMLVCPEISQAADLKEISLQGHRYEFHGSAVAFFETRTTSETENWERIFSAQPFYVDGDRFPWSLPPHVEYVFESENDLVFEPLTRTLTGENVELSVFDPKNPGERVSFTTMMFKGDMLMNNFWPFSIVMTVKGYCQTREAREQKDSESVPLCISFVTVYSLKNEPKKLIDGLRFDSNSL